MSKSQGNILKISSFKENVNGQALRLALISTHYRQPLDWSDKLLEEGIGKAGGYAIQGVASKFIRKIKGSYTNVVGLSIPEVYKIFKII